MKNQFARLNLLVSQISPRTMQLAFLAFALVMAIVQAPSDGPGGVR